MLVDPNFPSIPNLQFRYHMGIWINTNTNDLLKVRVKNYQALIGFIVNGYYEFFILIKYFEKFMYLMVWVTHKAFKGKFPIQVMIFLFAGFLSRSYFAF